MGKKLMKLGATMLSMAMLAVPAYGVSAAANTDGVALFNDGGNTVFNDGNDTSVSTITEEKNSSASNGERIFEKKYKVTASELNVRRTPSTAYEPIGTLKKGTIVKVKSFSGGWAKIVFGAGIGYVKDDYLEAL